MTNIKSSIYDNQHVKDSCEKAARAAVTHDAEWGVWLDPETQDAEWPRMFTGPIDDPLGSPFVLIYDTVDGNLF